MKNIESEIVMNNKILRDIVYTRFHYVRRVAELLCVYVMEGLNIAVRVVLHCLWILICAI